jgi:hypothetical protein
MIATNAGVLGFSQPLASASFYRKTPWNCQSNWILKASSSQLTGEPASQDVELMPLELALTVALSCSTPNRSTATDSTLVVAPTTDKSPTVTAQLVKEVEWWEVMPRNHSAESSSSKPTPTRHSPAVKLVNENVQ